MRGGLGAEFTDPPIYCQRRNNMPAVCKKKYEYVVEIIEEDNFDLRFNIMGDQGWRVITWKLEKPFNHPAKKFYRVLFERELDILEE